MTNESRTPHCKPARLVAALSAAIALGCAAAQAFTPDDQACRRATPEQLAWLPGDARNPFVSAAPGAASAPRQ
jgi:ABC-type sugar transport system substrate-binding protein